MGHKAAETTRNINKAFGPGTASEHTVQWWFKKFCKADESLRRGAQWLATGSWQWPMERNHQSGSSYNNARSCWKTQCHPFYGHLAFEEKRKDEEAQQVGASWADWKSKQLSFWRVIFPYSTQQWTISKSDCDVQQKVHLIWQLAMSSSVVGQRSAKALPKGKLAANKGEGCCLVSAVSLIHFGFLTPGKTITSEKSAPQIYEMHQKLQRLQPALVNRKDPMLFHNSATFTWSHASWLPLFQAPWQLFLQGKHFHNQQEEENALQEFVKSRTTDFSLQE